MLRKMHIATSKEIKERLIAGEGLPLCAIDKNYCIVNFVQRLTKKRNINKHEETYVLSCAI